MFNTIPALGHSYGSWSTTKAATCTATGTQKRTCSRCSNVETNTLAALGHSYSSAWTTDVKPSCLSKGSKSHHCTRCSSKSSVTAIASFGGHDYRPTSAAVMNHSAKTTSLSLRCADCGTSMSKVFDFDGHGTDTYTSCGYYCVGWTDLTATIENKYPYNNIRRKLRYPSAKFFVMNYAGSSWDQTQYNKICDNLKNLWDNSKFYVAYDTSDYSKSSSNPWERALAYMQDTYKNAYWQ